MPMKNPPHPGDFIRTEIIEPAGLSVTSAAEGLHVSRISHQTVSFAKKSHRGEHEDLYPLVQSLEDDRGLHNTRRRHQESA
jgi:hypothetical protein